MGLGAFEAIAHPTSQPQVFFNVSSAAPGWDNMIYLKRPQNIPLLASAIATLIARLKPDTPSKFI